MWDPPGLFDDLVDDAMRDDVLAVDFAAGVQNPIPAGGSASSDVVWQFGHFDALTLTEPSGSRLTGSSVAVPVTARNHGDALAGRTVRYTVTGANPTSGTVATSASGAAAIAWTGTKAGTDRLHALIDDNGDGIEQQDEAADDISVTFDARPADRQRRSPPCQAPRSRPATPSRSSPLSSTRAPARRPCGSGSPAPASCVGSSLPRCTQGARPARSQSHGSPGPPPKRASSRSS